MDRSDLEQSEKPLLSDHTSSVSCLNVTTNALYSGQARRNLDKKAERGAAASFDPEKLARRPTITKSRKYSSTRKSWFSVLSDVGYLAKWTLLANLRDAANSRRSRKIDKYLQRQGMRPEMKVLLHEAALESRDVWLDVVPKYEDDSQFAHKSPRNKETLPTAIADFARAYLQSSSQETRWRLYSFPRLHCERKKWLHFFADTSSVIFTVDIRDYARLISEDPNLNHMEGSIVYWDSMVNSRFFEKTKFAVCLIHIEELDELLRREPLDRYFKDCQVGDPPGPEKAKEYFATRFRALNRTRSSGDVKVHMIRGLPQEEDWEALKQFFAA